MLLLAQGRFGRSSFSRSTAVSNVRAELRRVLLDATVTAVEESLLVPTPDGDRTKGLRNEAARTWTDARHRSLARGSFDETSIR